MWQLVTKELVQKCVRKTGIFTAKMDVETTRKDNDADPFLECDKVANLITGFN